MKAPVFAIKRFAVHDGDGVRTTLFLSGCPLRCKWCHNPEGLEARRVLAYYEGKCQFCGACAQNCPTGAHNLDHNDHILDRTRCVGCGLCAQVCIADALTLYGCEMTAREVLPQLLEDRPFYGQRGGVTLSGGECLLHADFCLELAQDLRREGIGVNIDTCGDVPYDSLSAMLPYTDLFLYDVKAYHGDVHLACTGRDNQRILKNLKRLCKAGAQVEVRVPYVPTCNDTEMPDIASLLATLPIEGVRILPYHSPTETKYRAIGLPPSTPFPIPTKDEIERVRAVFERAGVHVKR